MRSRKMEPAGEAAKRVLLRAGRKWLANMKRGRPVVRGVKPRALRPRAP